MRSETIILAGLFFLVMESASGQTALTFENCAEIRSVLLTRGDVLTVACDTVYVLNTLTFRRFDVAYKDLRKKGPSVANLMETYDEIIALQDRRLIEQQEAYTDLRKRFDELAGASAGTAHLAASRLGLAITSIDTLQRDLAETRRLLDETQEILESERRGLDLGKALWGVGGLAVGIIVGAVITR